MKETRRRRRPARPLAAAGLALLIALGVWAAPAQARQRANCSGAVQGNTFHFKCDEQIGGNSRGWLFGFYSRSVENVSVSSPGGIACTSERGRMLCKGGAIPANATVSGSFTQRPSGGGEEGGEESEGSCPGGVSLIVIAYGGDSAEGEPPPEEGEGEEEGEAIPVPVGVARFGINSCGTGGSEGGRGGEEGTFSFGKVKLHKERGTAILAVKVTAAGTIGLRGENVVKVTKVAKAAGTVRLAVKPRGVAKALLAHTGHVTVKAIVTYTPEGGEAATKSKKIKLALI